MQNLSVKAQKMTNSEQPERKIGKPEERHGKAPKGTPFGFPENYGVYRTP
jgi:hypothetical protein